MKYGRSSKTAAQPWGFFLSPNCVQQFLLRFLEITSKFCPVCFLQIGTNIPTSLQTEKPDQPFALSHSKFEEPDLCFAVLVKYVINWNSIKVRDVCFRLMYVLNIDYIAYIQLAISSKLFYNRKKHFSKLEEKNSILLCWRNTQSNATQLRPETCASGW